MVNFQQEMLLCISDRGWGQADLGCSDSGVKLRPFIEAELSIPISSDLDLLVSDVTGDNGPGGHMLLQVSSR